MSDIMAIALEYAQKGLYLFPCKKDKTPFTVHGVKDATNDLDKINAWWKEFPNASIGLATGEKSGVWCVDIDLPDGPKSWAEIIKQYGSCPETLEQITGGGGKQLFFKYNGTVIKNNVGKLGVGIDVRGENGYSILPPSPHPSGGTYRWENKIKPIHAPEWLLELLKSSEPIPTMSGAEKTDRYAQKALANEIMAVSMSGSGTRNDTLNKAAYSLGQLIAGGCLNEGHAMAGLIGAATAVGLTAKEARATIASGFRSGASSPRTAPIDEDIEYTINEQNEQNEQTTILVSNLSTDEHGISKNEHEMSTSVSGKAFNLTGLITEFVENSNGSFTTKDIDHEFGLTTRREKNTRSQILYKLSNKKLIIKDNNISGKYHILKTDLEFVDLDAPAEEQFPLTLPFNIHNHIIIPPHSIVILAGSSNAGKSAFILNTLWMNRMRQYDKLYLMSEMGNGEYITRIKKFCTNWKEEWKAIKAASKSCDFNGAIEHHNKNGLTFVDYLEEVEGEYYKIPSIIRAIYDSLGEGVCFVALQKKMDGKIGRGGEGTLEKARLYMALDHFAVGEQSIICSLRMVKIKNFIGKNIQGHEIHFRLSKGHKIDQLTDWMMSSRVDRDAYKTKYEQEVDLATEKTDINDIVMVLADGTPRRITDQTSRQWQKQFHTFDVRNELERIASQSKGKPFLTTNYFFQISGILKKKHDAEIKRLGGL